MEAEILRQLASNANSFFASPLGQLAINLGAAYIYDVFKSHRTKFATNMVAPITELEQQVLASCFQRTAAYLSKQYRFDLLDPLIEVTIGEWMNSDNFSWLPPTSDNKSFFQLQQEAAELGCTHFVEWFLRSERRDDKNLLQLCAVVVRQLLEASCIAIPTGFNEVIVQEGLLGLLDSSDGFLTKWNHQLTILGATADKLAVTAENLTQLHSSLSDLVSQLPRTETLTIRIGELEKQLESTSDRLQRAEIEKQLLANELERRKRIAALVAAREAKWLADLCDYDGAINKLEECVSEYPTWWGYGRLANCLTIVHRFNEAWDALRTGEGLAVQAGKTLPTDWQLSYFMLANEQGNIEESRNILLAMRPKYRKAHEEPSFMYLCNLSTVYTQLGQFIMAEETLRGIYNKSYVGAYERHTITFLRAINAGNAKLITKARDLLKESLDICREEKILPWPVIQKWIQTELPDFNQYLFDTIAMVRDV